MWLQDRAERWGQKESGLGLINHQVEQRKESKGWVIQGPWASPALWGGCNLFRGPQLKL